jgi:hypothetical protein
MSEVPGHGRNCDGCGRLFDADVRSADAGGPHRDLCVTCARNRAGLDEVDQDGRRALVEKIR